MEQEEAGLRPLLVFGSVPAMTGNRIAIAALIACKNSIQIDSEITEDLVKSDDAFQSTGKIHNIEWMT